MKKEQLLETWVVAYVLVFTLILVQILHISFIRQFQVASGEGERREGRKEGRKDS